MGRLNYRLLPSFAPLADDLSFALVGFSVQDGAPLASQKAPRMSFSVGRNFREDILWDSYDLVESHRRKALLEVEMWYNFLPKTSRVFKFSRTGMHRFQCKALRDLRRSKRN